MDEFFLMSQSERNALMGMGIDPGLEMVDETGWRNVLGPFCLDKGVQDRFRPAATPSSLPELRDDHEILGCKTAGGTWVYPTFQFADDGDALVGLAAVLRHLVPASDGWSAGLWLRTPQSTLTGRSPASWLADGGAIGTAVLLAEAQAEVWKGTEP